MQDSGGGSSSSFDDDDDDDVDDDYYGLQLPSDRKQLSSNREKEWKVVPS